MRRRRHRAEGPQGGLRCPEEAGVTPFPQEDVDNDEYAYGHDVRHYHSDGEGDS